MIWKFDPDSLGPVRTDGKTSFTEDELWPAEQQLPPCPGCGGSITMDWHRLPSLNGPDEYLPGRWTCPTVGCDPAPAIRASGS